MPETPIPKPLGLPMEGPACFRPQIKIVRPLLRKNAALPFWFRQRCRANSRFPEASAAFAPLSLQGPLLFDSSRACPIDLGMNLKKCRIAACPSEHIGGLQARASQGRIRCLNRSNESSPCCIQRRKALCRVFRPHAAFPLGRANGRSNLNRHKQFFYPFPS